MANLLKTIIENDKGELRRLEKMADKVFSYEDQMAALSDDELKAKTEEFKQRYQDGESLDDLLYEAFAVVLSVSWACSLIKYRSWGGLFFTMVTFQKCVQGKGKP